MNGLEKTRQVLAQTRNRAVLPLLAGGLRGGSPDVRAATIRAAVQRIDLASHSLLIRFIRSMEAPDRAVLAEAHRRMPHHAAPALKAALLGSDATLRENACDFILTCQDFDSMPVLLRACAENRPPVVTTIAATILELADRLHDRAVEWAQGGDRSATDPSFVRHRALGALERFLCDARRKVPREVLEAFLLLAPSEHPALLSILGDSRNPSHHPLVAILTESDNPSVFDRLVSLLRDTDAPPAALEVIAQRADRTFVEYLLRSLRHPAPLRVVHNMKQIRSVAWLESQRAMLLDLDGRAQALAIELAVASGMSRTALFDLLAMILREGLAEGRRAACEALAPFDEPPADMLVLLALEDPDGGVQAAAARQLRPRRLPDALRVLVELLDSPSAEVRDAARSSLEEFNFVRYRAMFDLLDEHAIRTTGALVHRVDGTAIDGLLEELTSPSVSARLRGIEMAIAMEATQEVCEQLVELAKHENAAVRTEALAALAHCAGPNVVEVLQAAAGDANHSIADTARRSLAALGESADPAPPNKTSSARPEAHRGLLPCLFALRDLPRVWGRFDHQRPSDGTNQLLLLAGLAVAIAAVFAIWLRLSRRPQRRFTSNSPAGIFRELCLAHGLSFSQRRLLKRLAKERGLADPGLVFIEPLHFDGSSLPASLQPAAAELQRLRARLFG